MSGDIITDIQQQPNCKNGCHLAEYIVSKIPMKAHGRKFEREWLVYIDYLLIFDTSRTRSVSIDARLL